MRKATQPFAHLIIANFPFIGLNAFAAVLSKSAQLTTISPGEVRMSLLCVHYM